MKLTLTISTLQGGGAERVLTTLANAWADGRHDVAIVTLDDAPSVYPLSRHIRRIGLGMMGASTSVLEAFTANAKRLAALEHALITSEPDVVISFMDRMNVSTLLASLGLNFPVIVSERVHPAHNEPNRVWELARDHSYRWADKVVVQTRGVASFFARKGVETVEVIPNPVVPPTAQATLSDRRIVAAGRLHRQKGFDRLIEAFGRVDQPEWRLDIFGEGAEHANLAKQIRDLNLSDRVRLRGFRPNLHEEMATASIFVLPSRYEGFPNVLCEAMAMGLPCIAFDCPDGPSDIIHQGEDGLLVDEGNVAQLTEAIQHLIRSPGDRTGLGQKARQVQDRFSLERTIDSWEAVLEGVIAAQANIET